MLPAAIQTGGRTVKHWISPAGGLAFGLALVPAVPALAQDYPQRPVRVVVPFSPGAGTDLIARVIAQHLTIAWGQQFIVENRAGGGAGTIGSASVARAPADGYTLLMANASSHNVAPHLYKKMPYDAIRDFAPVHLGGRVPHVLAIHPSLPVRDVKGFIALARARPGQLSYSSSGNGSSLHLAGELFKSMAKVDILHVPYKGAAIGMTDLVAGQVQASFASISTTLPFVKQARLRPLGVTALTRFPLLPDVPTIAEAALPGYELINWIGLVAPAQTPREIVSRLNAEIARWAGDAANQEKMAAVGIVIEPMTPAEFGEMLAKGLATTGKLMASIGFTQE
jgi:tripartite-type tricarboxylate transporter receptor subunit TctC